ncbi:MAG TPA: hypothetical protein VGF71_04125 [Caulobacteraceae bacterium]|jgi:predicted GH43/DUF377 family glycosyl hydrolase
MKTVTYVVEQIDEVTIAAGSPLDGLALMSPYVWKDGDTYRMMVRGLADPLGPDDPTGVIGSAYSHDGLVFESDPKLSITPDGALCGEDAGGCEDPTVVVTEKGRYLIYYTGVDVGRTQGGLIVASGPGLTRLTKQRVVLKAPPGEGNIKEATVAQAARGDWRLFYEYAAHDASRIGMASGPTADGPWTVEPDPFTVRADSWDDWHLSTGPIIGIDGADPVMFYNGATGDARWRIGWISFDPDFQRMTGRGLEPVILPPPAKSRTATDIAFAASTVSEGAASEGAQIALYYSLEDRVLRRALVRRFTG